MYSIHIPHVDASSEIQRLQLSASLKRKAEEDDAPLRQIFTCVSYAEARNRYRLDVCLYVCHTLVLYENG